MKNVRIAIQSKGKLADPSISFLTSLGLMFTPNGRNSVVSCKNYELDILFLRDDDIAKYVNRGVADFGIVGENVLLEQNIRVKTVKKLGFAACSLVIAVLQMSSVQDVQDLAGKDIATTYPNLLKRYLAEEKIAASVLSLKGSVEVAPNLEFSDAICDLIQTGQTLKENGLKSIATILESQAVLIQSPFLTERNSKKVESLFLT